MRGSDWSLRLVIVLAALTAALVYASEPSISAFASGAVAVTYLAGTALFLNRMTVALPRGTLNLTAIACNAAGMVLPVLPAATAGLIAGIAYQPAIPARIPRATKRASWFGYAFWTALGAAVHGATLQLDAPL